MRNTFAAFAGTVRRLVGSKLIVRFNSAKDGWWITDSMGHRHYLIMSLCKLVSPDNMVARRITLFRWNLEFGFIQRPNAQISGGTPSAESDCYAGDCTTCGGPVFHREGKPGEYDHECRKHNAESEAS